MSCKNCENTSLRLDALEKRIAYLEEWIDIFEEGAEQAMQELEEQFGAVEVTFVPDPSLMRDKTKDN
jgi:transcription elongation factor Elf1